MIFISTFAALDNLFHPLLFIGGILFTLNFGTSPYITHTLSAVPGLHYSPRPLSPTPGCHYPSPAILLILVDMCPTIFPNTYRLCPPAILIITLPASDAPYSLMHNPCSPPVSPAV